MSRFSRWAAAASIPIAAGLMFTPGSAADTERVPPVPDAAPALSEMAPTARIVDRKQLPNGATRTTVRMGPIVTQPHYGHGGGEHGHGTHTTIAGPWTPPCVNCYLTSVKPDLTYADGSSANYDTGVTLHHAVLFDRSKKDVTCGDSRSFYELTGRRLFASGNERTAGRLPAGFGVKLGKAPMTWGAAELMNMKPEPQAVFVEATITHVPASTPGMEAVTPVWLDSANCTGDSQHSVPAGASTTTWRWQSTISGTVKAAGGHLHDGGRSLALSNASSGRHMCTSTAGYGTDPAYMGHIESMSVCSAQHLGAVRRGDVLQLDSTYQMDHAANDVMSIMLAYIDQED